MLDEAGVARVLKGPLFSANQVRVEDFFFVFVVVVARVVFFFGLRRRNRRL